MDRAARRRANRAGAAKIAGVWLSNAPYAPTGYGTQTNQVVRRMVADGHQMVVACNYGLEAVTTNYEGIELWPRGFDVYSNDVVAPYFRDWSRQHPGLKPYLFTLYDVWTFQGPRWDTMPVVSWVPIDHLPVPPAVEAFCRKPNVTPVAMSLFGKEQLGKRGISCEYVPHAVETSVFKPTPRVQQDDGRWLTGREIMGIAEDAYVVLIANANKSGGNVHRKAFPEQVLAFSIFAQQHPDAVLFIHSEQYGSMGGLPFDPLLSACGLKPHQVRFVNQYQLRVGIPQEVLAAIYTASDVLLSPTYGEGFGITVVEAQACGLPVIVSDFTAQDELAGPDSMKVSGQPWWDASQMAWWSIPSVPAMVEALNASYARGRVRSEGAISWIEERYSADRVYRDHWQPLLASLAERESEQPAGFTVATSLGSTGSDLKLTIYIPTYRRSELSELLDSLKPQLTSEVEIVISDNDGQAAPLVTEQMYHAPCPVRYERRASNIGGDANIVRGWTQGSAPWVWIIGDDDVVNSDALRLVLQRITDETIDRVILLSESAPREAAGAVGSLRELAELDPALPLAATLVSANVCRRSAVNLAAAIAAVDTKYGHAYGMPTERVAVLAEPALSRVGYQHAGDGIPAGWDGQKVKDDWLRHVGIEPNERSYSWNYMSVERRD